MFPILVLKGGGHTCHAQSQSRASGIPHLHRGCVCSEMSAPAHPAHPGCAPASSLCLCLHQGGQQGCGQEPFADSEDFLHEWTNYWLILLARGLESKCGGSEACFCYGWWRQEDASSASRAGLSQSPWLLAEKPKMNMSEGSESKLSPSQGYL